ncbi:hypothetical protein Btru_064017 [Bulinus truncatus]|nr:hypothetical protein Btru_064017 [Bulinus truncatus]
MDCVASLPRDDQKIRNLLIPGSLFLYQLPPPPHIQPMSEEEEETNPCTLNSEPHSGSHESLDLPDIQRSCIKGK